ncbi:MAG TPA: tyrosine-type recombinase/integrase [Acidimicrobiia bacterium]|jgi:integrase|nr:tyrosine-type recombinase/integrase [Acidimicrobiia bacterium]
MGSVRRSPKTSRWEARYRDPLGHQRTKTFATKADARAFLAATQTDVMRGQWLDPAGARITYREWSEHYFATAVHKRATTAARDRTVNDKHFIPRIGTRRLGSLTPLDVRDLVEEMSRRLAPATVRTNYGVLRTILRSAVDTDLIAQSPCRGVRLPPDTKRRRFLSADELIRLAQASPVEYRAMVFLAGVLGLRWSEIAGLRVSRIDLARRTLEVAETCAEVNGRISFAEPKTAASRRTLRVPEFLAALLAEHLASRGHPGPDALVFVAPQGGPLRRTTFRTRVFQPAVRRAELDGITFHELRHTSAGLMIEMGAHIEAIKQRLGHSTIRVTSDVYGSLLPTVDESITAGFDARFGNAFEHTCGENVVNGAAGTPGPGPESGETAGQSGGGDGT